MARECWLNGWLARAELVSDFHSNDDLTSALIASQFIPGWTHGPWCAPVLFRGAPACDGGLLDNQPCPPEHGYPRYSFVRFDEHLRPPTLDERLLGRFTPGAPDGPLSFECPPGEYILDAAEELDNADDFADLPYACRAGSCSACAGKLVKGTMDLSACSFLTPEQKADGWVLTCTAIPTSDVVIETHKEDDMY